MTDPLDTGRRLRVTWASDIPACPWPWAESQHLPEEWRPIPRSRGYEVSSLGRYRYPDGHSPEPKMAPARGRFPAAVIARIRELDGKVHVRNLDRLVLTAWVGEPPEGKPHAIHIDGDLWNCQLSNLKWGRRS
jgi:hypothetical protein